jgi:cytochrome c nitrite reductase small subunit
VVHISRAASYLSDEPEVCINCHVMDNAYATWRHGSHGRS